MEIFGTNFIHHLSDTYDCDETCFILCKHVRSLCVIIYIYDSHSIINTSANNTLVRQQRAAPCDFFTLNTLVVIKHN